MTSDHAGRLAAIARRPARRAPMEEVEACDVSRDRGIEGDHKGVKFKNRAVTILAREDWAAALGELADHAGAAALPWTVRRANLLVEGVRLPRARGALIDVGPVRLEVTYPTVPCARMDEAHAGLKQALHPEWRGGVTCRVITDGAIRIGDAVVIVDAGQEKSRWLPG